MWPDQVSNPGPLTYESGALPTALRSPDKRNFLTYNIKGLPLLHEKMTFYVVSMTW